MNGELVSYPIIQSNYESCENLTGYFNSHNHLVLQYPEKLSGRFTVEMYTSDGSLVWKEQDFLAGGVQRTYHPKVNGGLFYLRVIQSESQVYPTIKLQHFGN